MIETEKKTVLIADDEPGVRRLVNKILSKDYAVIEAQNGAEVLKIVRSQKVDIILMDIMMPDMDGLTALCAIKTDISTRELPVLMVTAIDHELNRKLSQNVMGADGYIIKPFNPEDLLSTVNQMLCATSQKRESQTVDKPVPSSSMGEG